jgi:hypothetical protein
MKGTGPEKAGMLPPERLLDGVPFRNTSVREESGNGGATLWAPVRRRWWMRPPFSWLLPLRGQKGFRLDAIGLAVWRACDGTRTVERIVEEFSARHRVSFHEARIVVMSFLQELTRRQLVAVVIDRREC